MRNKENGKLIFFCIYNLLKTAIFASKTSIICLLPSPLRITIISNERIRIGQQARAKMKKTPIRSQVIVLVGLVPLTSNCVLRLKIGSLQIQISVDQNSEILKVLGVLEGEGRIFMKQKSQAYEVMPCPPPHLPPTHARAHTPPPPPRTHARAHAKVALCIRFTEN